MNPNCLLFCISTYFIASTVAYESIIGGHKAKRDQFPYHVALKDSEHDYICGGGIISEQFILTAGHCVVQTDGRFRQVSMTIVAGTNDLLKMKKPTVLIVVEKVYVPTEYSPWEFDSTADIAVLKLKKPLKFSRYIEKLKLPIGKVETYAGMIATISGFGWVNVKHNEFGMVCPVTNNTHLFYAEVQIFDNDEYNHRPGIHHISKKHMLSRIVQNQSKQRGTCMGDSGGSLVHNNTVVGVLSLSPKEYTDEERPAVYTRVSEYLEFIHDALNDRNNKFIRSYKL